MAVLRAGMAALAKQQAMICSTPQLNHLTVHARRMAGSQAVLASRVAQEETLSMACDEKRDAVTAAASANLKRAARQQWRQGHDTDGRLLLKALTLEQLEAFCMEHGERPQRALQLWRWMYDRRMLALEDSLGQQDGFSAAFIDKLAPIASIDGGLQLERTATAADGTRKLVFRLTEGEGTGGSVETVLIPGQGQRRRTTLCVSSQVGCAMNCQFCFTGQMGLRANLSAAQIVEQVVQAQRLLAGDHARGVEGAEQLTNVVFMGMGEPLHNVEAVLAATDIMCHPLGLHLSHNKVTVSTVGLVPAIEQFLQHSKAQLAVSLHATTDEVRDWIAPVNRRWPLGELLACLERHFPRATRCGGAHGRHVLIEYVMLEGINDSRDDAHRLVALLEPVEAKVNLIVFNPHEGTRFKASSTDQVQAFRDVLMQAGRVCTLRSSRGDDEMAACGQLGEARPAHRRAAGLQASATPGSCTQGKETGSESTAVLAHSTSMQPFKLAAR